MLRNPKYRIWFVMLGSMIGAGIGMWLMRPKTTQPNYFVVADTTHQTMCWVFSTGVSCLPMQFVSGPH